ncbi:guanine nucleotide-binding protein G(I)/G(S)/G(O) subunit gamma-T2 isoform X2 [Serinus canaria]|uniref:guanine nucleotide-binding protein G(I)/G(S)/G(O) subunit gamma-T2 isoform X2 n=1 Tax=Serinus canaria TaxID=9135 RepID=UPI0021CC85D9|nr:guanine nucleotide-binding protein G(I)/G(S)/G(O) subunit gamma-T2 isoform X2 [Serinus canaria]
MSLSRSRSSSDIAPGPAPTSSPPWRFEAAAGADAGPEGAAVSPCPPRGHPALPATSWGPAGRKARGPGRGGDSTGLAARAAGKDFQGAMAQDMTEKELLKMELDQLKKEVKNERQMVSKTGKEIKDYIESMAGEDPLLKGVPEDKNPFKEKGGCTIS